MSPGLLNDICQLQDTCISICKQQSNIAAPTKIYSVVIIVLVFYYAVHKKVLRKFLFQKKKVHLKSAMFDILAY